MYRRIWDIAAVSIICVIGMTGCVVTKSRTSVILPSSAFFVADPGDLKTLQSVAKAQEARLKSCAKSTACEEAYYTRGLVALFENRADAINVFQELHTTIPNSRYATSSQRWLSLLQDTSPASSHNRALLAQLREEILHHLLEREDTAVGRRSKEQERKTAELGR
ncbi:MAG: hypothetical protein NW701_08545 [Nitrospira sp.]